MLKHFGGQQNTILFEPAAFRRLCVETISALADGGAEKTSRLQAAVC